MQSACPVNCNIAFPSIQSRCSLHAAARADAAKLKQAIKNRTIITYIVSSLLLHEVVHVVRRHALQEIHVLVGMELCHLVLGCRLCAVDLQLLVQAVVHDQGMRHPDTVGLHGVSSVVCVVSDI